MGREKYVHLQQFSIFSSQQSKIVHPRRLCSHNSFPRCAKTTTQAAMAVPLPCAASQQGSTCSSSISTLRSSTSLEVEHQHVVPAALTLVPPVLRLQGGGPVEEDRDAHAHDAVDGGAAHEGVAARLQAEARRGCSRGCGCSSPARTAPPRQKNGEEEARDKKMA